MVSARVIATRIKSAEPVLVVVPRSVLEGDLLMRNAELVAAMVERYEQPLELYRLNRAELEALEAQMRSTMATFGAVRKSAGLIEIPGWLRLMATEYGCVKDALRACPVEQETPDAQD